MFAKLEKINAGVGKVFANIPKYGILSDL